MSSQACQLDVTRFRSAISQRIGLQFDDSRTGFLGEVLQRRLDKKGYSSEAYLWDLQRETCNGEIGALARELTVGETYFFRNIEQFRALAEVVLPERMGPPKAPKTLRLLSAGCASGEEAYSMAIVAREGVTDPSWQVEIRAVDLNPGALEKAERASYSPWALRETPGDARQRWFRTEGRDVVLDETVRATVKFEQANLASEAAQIWQPNAYDVIFCRNVLMYFAPEQMRAAVARIAQSLADGGFLFLGHAETLRGISDEFHLRHTHGTFYYERKGRSGRSFANPGPVTANWTDVRTAPSEPSDAWFHSICKATERVAALVPAPCKPDRPNPPASIGDVTPAFDLLRQERFAEALEHVRRLLPTAQHDPDLLLLEAALLMHSGQMQAAEEACLRLLLIDDLNAAAHYVLGLCREQSADHDSAAEHYRVATYLDPAFAMPRLHLGLLAQRAGDREATRRELAQALLLLKREDASRLLLFGGGFKREALVALCESALKESGART